MGCTLKTKVTVNISIHHKLLEGKELVACKFGPKYLQSFLLVVGGTSKIYLWFVFIFWITHSYSSLYYSTNFYMYFIYSFILVSIVISLIKSWNITYSTHHLIFIHTQVTQEANIFWFSPPKQYCSEACVAVCSSFGCSALYIKLIVL